MQLIESPIFTYLRLQLLNREDNEDLVYVLYGLLMILPQSEAYATLQGRLSAIPPKRKKLYLEKKERSHTSYINFIDLLHHFHTVQDKHKEHKHKQRLISLIERNIKL